MKIVYSIPLKLGTANLMKTIQLVKKLITKNLKTIE